MFSLPNPDINVWPLCSQIKNLEEPKSKLQALIQCIDSKEGQEKLDAIGKLRDIECQLGGKGDDILESLLKGIHCVHN